MSIPERALPQDKQRIVPIGMAATPLPPLPGGWVATGPDQPGFCPRKDSK